ncbi:MAG TPA: hypothetical protein V6D22_26425 [Candidatus Obscuribacterales bacterium]
MTTYTVANDDSVEINLFFRGTPVSQNAAAAFQNLLASVTTERELTADEVTALEQIFGNAGKNQYTMQPYMGRTPVPAFNLSSAKVTKLNGVGVALVWGNFQNAERVAGKEFYGLFVADPRSPAMIYELFYQADDKIKFLCYLNDFEAALHSIKWM